MVYVSIERAAPALELTGAWTVVVATVVDVETTSRWATPSGERPVAKYVSQVIAALYTVAHVQVTGVVRGRAAVGRTLTVRVQGGTFAESLSGATGGCTTVEHTGNGSITPGASVLLFLGSVPALRAADTPADFDVTDSWAVDNQVVMEPDGTSVSVDALIAQAQGN